MKSIVKKVAIYTMVGIMQVGFGASIAAASPIHNEAPSAVWMSNGNHGHDNDRQREHDERMKNENQRHEREMRRHPGESERAWHERQERERQRHEEALREIAAFLLGIAVGNANN